MAILIKGMEMPENCLDCPLCYDSQECIVADPHLTFWRNGSAWKNGNEGFKMKNERHKSCPLVEIQTPRQIMPGAALEAAGFEL